jgi:hypothetical protein
VAGCCSVIRNALLSARLKSPVISSAMFKAVVVNGAESLKQNKAPATDGEGFGRVNLEKSLCLCQETPPIWVAFSQWPREPSG